MQYFARFKEDALGGDDDLYATLLAPIVAARAPLPTAVLQALVNLSSSSDSQSSSQSNQRAKHGQRRNKPRRQTKAAKAKERRAASVLLGKAKQLLFVGGGVVRFVHKSMVDWLTS